MKLLRRGCTSLSVIVIVAFILRGAYFWWGQIHMRLPIILPPFGFETGRIAQSIAVGKGFSSPLSVDSGPTVWLTPIYPYFLAGIFKIFGVYTYASLLVATTFNLLFSALTCIPIFHIAKRIGGFSVAVLSAWLWVIFPTAITIPVEWIWDTSLSALAAAVILWVTLEIRDSSRTRDWIGYGLLWGTSLMINAVLFSLMPFLLGWLAWEHRKVTSQWLRLPSLAAIVMALVCVPWTVRNYVVFHQFIPFRSNFALELWLGNNDQVPDTWAGFLHPNDYPPERAKFLALGEIAYMRDKQKEAIHFMIGHPRDEIRFFWRRFAETWTMSWDPVQDAWGHLGWNGRGKLIVNLAPSFLGFLGLFVLSRQKNPYIFPVAMYPLIFPVVYYITHPSRRYRHPIDPVLIVLAGFGITYLVRTLAGKRASSIPAPIGGSVPDTEPSTAL